MTGSTRELKSQNCKNEVLSMAKKVVIVCRALSLPSTMSELERLREEAEAEMRRKAPRYVQSDDSRRLP
jgi:hypothetical protein